MTQDKNIKKYIDKILNFPTSVEKEWMYQLKLIPEGGLRGLIYYKLCNVDYDNFYVNLIVSKNFSPISYTSLDIDLQAKICKLLGIFLDNSLQAIAELSSKKISIYINQKKGVLEIQISNNYKGYVNMDEIGNIGYTTKSNSHGFGLYIANKILENENRISKETSINGSTFCQKIKIKL